MKKILAALFDFDGTLVNSEEYYLTCGVKSMVELGVKESEARAFYRAQMAGIRSDLKPAIFTKKFPHLDYQVYNRRYLELCDTLKKDLPIKIKPGANELLHYLKQRGIKLALVTMSTYDEVQEVCAETGLDYSVFDYYFGGANVPPKPDPTIYREAMQALGVTAEETMIVEDSNVGALAAIGSGATTVVVKDQCVLSDEVLQRADKVLEMDCLLQVKDFLLSL